MTLLLIEDGRFWGREVDMSEFGGFGEWNDESGLGLGDFLGRIPSFERLLLYDLASD